MSKKTVLCAFGLVFGFATTAFAQADANPADAPADPAAPAAAPEAAPAPAPAEASTSVSTTGGEPGKFVVGLRLGYGLPMGDAIKDSAMSDMISGMIPIWLDLGYNITPNIMAGLYGQYAIVSIKDCPSGADCSGSDIRFGLQGQYHVSPMEKIDPWFGLGIGYEMSSMKQSAGGAEATIGFNGMEYLNLQGGADFKLSPAFGVGPFLSFSLGQYGTASIKSSGLAAAGIPDMDESADVPSDSKTMHEWLTFGIRGAFSL